MAGTDIATVEDRPEAAKDLTERQWRFVQEWFHDFNAAAAYRRAGYDGPRAKQAAYDVIHSRRVSEAIRELAPTYLGVSRTKILEGMGALAFNESETTTEEEIEEDGGRVKTITKEALISDAVKLQALDKLAKISGLYNDGPQTQTTVHINLYPEEHDL